MGLTDFVKNQFIDVIEFEDQGNKLLVYKYERPDNEIKQNAKVIVRESQAAIFLKNGKLADILPAGTHTLNTNNLPILSTLGAFAYGFNSPIKSDLYFVSLRQFVGNKWLTPKPIILKDREFNLVRVSAFGSFAFRVVDAEKFMKEVFGTQQKVLTYPIIQYLASIINETFAVTIAQCNVPVIEFAVKYKEISAQMSDSMQLTANSLGLEFSNIIIENISLPEEVEKYIDEQSGIGMASKNMQTFMQYQSARAMRDAAQQEGGLAGLGVGFGLGTNMANTIKETIEKVKIKCPSCGALNDDNAKFCSECGMKLSSSTHCTNCGAKIEPGKKFCGECGLKI